MKKLFMILLAAGSGFALSAQQISIDKLPAAVKEAFKKAHPAAIAKWEMEDQDYEASFRQDGREVSCLFNSEGVLKETETSIKPEELPATIRDYMAKNHAGKKITEAAKIMSSDGSTRYEVETATMELVFDAAGKLLKQESETDEND